MNKILLILSFVMILLSSCTPIDSTNSNQVTQELSWNEVSQEETTEKKINLEDDEEIFSLIYLTLENIE